MKERKKGITNELTRERKKERKDELHKERTNERIHERNTYIQKEITNDVNKCLLKETKKSRNKKK